MKTLITVLIICSFLQSTILPIDLVLIILICRSYIKSDRANLILAFFFGLFNSHLNLNTLGVNSILYLVLVEITESLSKTRLAGNSFLIIPLSFVLLSINEFLTSFTTSVINQIALSFFNPQSLELLPKVFLESLLSLPILYLVRIWEERFIVRGDIKLKV